MTLSIISPVHVWKKVVAPFAVAKELFQEDWAFEPPVPKQFCIEGSDNDWIKTQFADFASLLPALFQKMAPMFRSRIFRCGAIIQLFLITGPGDPVIFHAGEFSV